jgi:ribonuclease HI
MVSAPHFLVYTEAHSDPAGGRWRFAVRRDTGRLVLEAADLEPGIAGPRLELLAVVRGLESFDYPAQVTLITSSNYVRRGISYGLNSWRQSGWTWEWFGQMVPVKNRDLWQRIDRALEFHQVVCRSWRVDAPAPVLAGPHRRMGEVPGRLRLPTSGQLQRVESDTAPREERLKLRTRLRGQRWLGDQASALCMRFAQLGTGLIPRPWFE